MIKLILNTFAYFGLALGFDQEVLGSRLIEIINISPIITNVIIFIAILAWIIKLVWFTYDKFYLERKERLKQLNK